MNVPKIPVLVLGAALWLLLLLVTATPQALTPWPVQAGRLPLEQGEALLVRMCNECHDVKTVTARRRTRAEWEHSINDMIQEGASGTAKEFEDTFAHLVATRGKVYVNDAPADEIAQVLGLSAASAGAIVEYRTKAGRFADLDALRKVPGLDPKVLDAQPDAVAF